MAPAFSACQEKCLSTWYFFQLLILGYVVGSQGENSYTIFQFLVLIYLPSDVAPFGLVGLLINHCLKQLIIFSVWENSSKAVGTGKVVSAQQLIRG